MTRSVFLVENVAGGWFVRVASSNGEKVLNSEAYSTPGNAVRAFVTEGRHQPCAGMVVLVEGQKPTVIRAARRLIDPDTAELEGQRDRTRAALAKRKA